MNELLEILQSNQDQFKFLYIILTLNLIVTFASHFFNLNLQKKNFKNLIKHEKNKRKVDIYENIHKDCKHITRLLFSSDYEQTLIDDIEKLHILMEENSLYLNKKTKNLVNDFLDQYSIVATKRNLVNPEKDKLFFRKFKNEFNKL